MFLKKWQGLIFPEISLVIALENREVMQNFDDKNAATFIIL
jgi:hypothetical protein